MDKIVLINNNGSIPQNVLFYLSNNNEYVYEMLKKTKKGQISKNHMQIVARSKKYN
jgi:hypothetical protein